MTTSDPDRTQTPATAALADGVRIRLVDAGLKYRFLSERENTIKGKFLALLSRGKGGAPEFWALRGVNLEIGEGEVWGIVGPNGAGKSTVLRLMAKVIEPTEGRVDVRGHVQPLLDITGTLNPNLTGRANCYLYAALHRIPREHMRDTIPRIIEFSELGAFFDVPVKCYSSGMTSRLAFSMATQMQPEILLADEILSVGDEHFQKKSFFRMLNLIERGSVVVMVSHNLSFVEQICTRAVLLAQSRVIEVGAPRDIVARYRREFL